MKKVSFEELGKELSNRFKNQFRLKYGYEYDKYLSTNTEDWMDDIRIAEENADIDADGTICGHIEITLDNKVLIEDIEIKREYNNEDELVSEEYYLN